MAWPRDRTQAKERFFDYGRQEAAYAQNDNCFWVAPGKVAL